MNVLDNPTYSLPPLIATVFSGFLCVVVARRAARSPAHLYFALFLLAVLTSSFLIFLMRLSPNVERALFWERLVIPVMLTSSICFYAFTLAYTRTDGGRKVLLAILLYLATILALAFKGMLVERMKEQSYGYTPIFGPSFYFVAAGGYLWILLGLLTLHRAYLRSKVYEERNRLLYIMVASLFPVAGTALDMLPWTYPANITGNLAFAAITTATMRRYHLLDVSLVVRKSLAYVLSSALIAVPYVALILMAAWLFPSSKARPFLYVLLVTVLAIALQPLWTQVQERVDKVFFRQRRDSLRALEEFTRRTHSIAELERPAHELVDVIRVAMQTSGVALLQPSETGDFVTVATSGREEVGRLQIGRNSPLVLFLDREQEPLEERRLDFDPRLQALANQDRQLLQAAGAVVLVPLRMRDHLSGILALGAKLSEEPYSREELTLLSLVATQTTVLLDDARLYQRTTGQLLQDRRRVEAFGTAVGQLGLEQDPGRALQKLVDTARELVGARHGAMDVWDEEGKMLRQIVSGSPILNYGTSLASLRGQEDDGAVANNGDRSLTPRESYRPFPHLAPAVRSSRNGVLSIPVLVKGKSRGVLYLEEKASAHEFSQDDERLVGLFAGVAGVLLDNTDLFSSVNQEKGTLAAILASMTEGLAVLGPDGHLELWNNAMELFTGVPAQEAVGRPWDETMGRMASDVENPQVLGPLREALQRGGMEPAVFEVTLVRPVRRQLLVKVFHIPEEAGTPLLGLLVRDMTQEKELEERRNSFISIASHELRTPMTTIVGFSEILLTHEVPREVRENWLRSIHQEGLRLSGIVDDLLDISRIQSGKMNVNLVRCTLGVAAEEAVTLATSMTTRHDVVVEIPPDLPEVWADKAKLVQVLTNLLTNAAKYSPAGGPITLSAIHEPDGERVVVSVADKGIGIAPENQTQLFQSFQRVNRRETLGIRGSGLGLYIVKSFVEMMGGEVWVESELNRGSTFSFSLSARPRNSAGPAQQRRDESAKESANS